MRHNTRKPIRTVTPPGVMLVVDRDGRAWPQPAGGNGEEDPPEPSEDPPSEDPPQEEDPPGDPEALGDPGKRALDAERQARKDAEREKRELQKKLEEAQRAQMDDHERALAEARDEAVAETATKYASRLAAARAEALAAARTHDPDAAVQLLGDLTAFVTEDGEVDTDAMSTALDELVEAKPYLKSDAATAPVGGADQGRRPPPGPTQLTREDLRGMSPEQIVEAKAEGRLEKVLGAH